MAAADNFDGVPLGDLEFEEIDWSHTREHVEQRDQRKGTLEFAPRVEWATEACADMRRLIGRTASAVVVVGFSASADRLLRVILRPLAHAEDGRWIGLTAHAASTKDRRRYEEQS